jgi:hypothetical protein
MNNDRTKPTPGSQQSIAELAEAERRNVDKHLILLGDTYGLIPRLEFLYDGLPRLCRLPLDIPINPAVHAAGVNASLMFACRGELTKEALSLLRGYRIDSLYHRRKAIELCAFAAKIARHPEFSKTWLGAGTSAEAFEKFRSKFKKLFPSNDAKLTFLSGAYDEASQFMHSSIFAVAHYFIGKNRLESVPEIGLFDITSDGVFVDTFILWIFTLLLSKSFKGF